MIKKLALGILASFLTACGSRADGSWAMATGEDNGRPLIIRYRNRLPEGVSKDQFPDLVALSWHFKSENGMPSKEEKNRMNDLEDSLIQSVEPAKQALLTVVVTGNGVTEWQFYSRDKDEFMRQLNKAFAGKPAFPIKVSLGKDPSWSAYERFASSK